MRVDPNVFTPPAPTGAVQRRPASGQGFAPSRAGGPTRSSGPAASTPLATMDALLAIQHDNEPEERRRRSLKRGHDLLGALDGLKAGLLCGRVREGDLRALTAQLSQCRDLSGDPRLDELLGHIELRAQVELAKLGAG